MSQIGPKFDIPGQKYVGEGRINIDETEMDRTKGNDERDIEVKRDRGSSKNDKHETNPSEVEEINCSPTWR